MALQSASTSMQDVELSPESFTGCIVCIQVMSGSLDGFFMFVYLAVFNTADSGILSVFIPPSRSELFQLQHTRLFNLFYIEASNLASVRSVLNAATHSGYRASTDHVDKANYDALLSRCPVSRVVSQLCAFFKSGPYQGDPCFVKFIDTDKVATVWCLPRIDLGDPPHPESEGFQAVGRANVVVEEEARDEDEEEAGENEDGPVANEEAQVNMAAQQTRRQHRSNGAHPPCTPFVPHRVARHYGRKALVRADGQITDVDDGQGGLLQQAVHLGDLGTELCFSYTLYLASLTAPQIPQQSADNYFLSYYSRSLRAGNTVTNTAGEQQGAVGRIVSISEDTALVELNFVSMSTQIPLSHLRRLFHIGNTVAVTMGVNRGQVGTVTAVFDKEITILSLSYAEELTIDARLVAFCEPLVCAAKAPPSLSDHLILAPNLNPTSIDPALLAIRTTSDLRARRDLCISKRVSIIKGPHKSYKGLVKSSSTNNLFVIELDALRCLYCTVQWKHLALIWENVLVPLDPGLNVTIPNIAAASAAARERTPEYRSEITAGPSTFADIPVKNAVDASHSGANLAEAPPTDAKITQAEIAKEKWFFKFHEGAWENLVMKTVMPLALCTVDYWAGVKLISVGYPLCTIDMPIEYLGTFLGNKGKKVLSIQGAYKGFWAK
ncbi:uncharacterized protein C8Q71DRAFT_857898 [Rhodofomes roseus]|uniref:KOW domain-containing protein n=1 Tax=Rhodofomes roseus TaxID=34475 RepID=A0ABQ8KG77_9APHY|nr:uncharacterized protein C8Q71DRAFT_857898 [Rhodofomes roseus]KAH9836676.1 hypothetical protein C8Q71DRAFT_857898 [Rhodofomes roseus]